MGEEAKRYAVVTGANKGLGFGICKKLAARGVRVVLTARDHKRGLEAVEKLKEFGMSDFVVFHQLDVTDPSSIASLAYFISTAFGKLDILVNNAGVSPGTVNGEALFRKVSGEEIDWDEIVKCNVEMSKLCVETNYFGAARVTEALLPMLHLSPSPTIVNVTSLAGLIKHIKNERTREVLSDLESLTREKLDEVVSEFMKDYEEGTWNEKGWPTMAPANTVAKTALNVYTRLMANKYPSFRVNSVSPGFVKTDMTHNYGFSTVDEASEHILRLALLPPTGPSGLFFDKDKATPLE
ncbi:(+)-neomenthol dehydrogenase-like [Prosopis cineraria]|uniref:(+)-neomenthol dehydrogenase-like n=1 Tax=Prosopis cineraria TaxID=364024 RepID=UPI00240F64AC|nr:(+)-neomenthol dehydrogenase-like [Prosopis cineraria]